MLGRSTGRGYGAGGVDRRICQTFAASPAEPGELPCWFRMEIYEIELCKRGRWEQLHARFVAAQDADEAAYKVTGEHLRSEGEFRKVRLRVRRLGNGSPPPKLFYAS